MFSIVICQLMQNMQEMPKGKSSWTSQASNLVDQDSKESLRNCLCTLIFSPHVSQRCSHPSKIPARSVTPTLL